MCIRYNFESIITKFYYSFSNFYLQTSSLRPEIANILEGFYYKNQAK